MLTAVDDPLDLPENVLSVCADQRAWNGVRLDVSEFRCAGRVVHRLRYGAETRLNAVLDEVGGRCEPRFRKDQPCPFDYTPRHMHFAPAGLEVWGYSADSRFVRDATLVFDLETMTTQLAADLPARALVTPRQRFSDDRIWTLVSMLSSAVRDPDPSTQLYGDGLTTAIVALLFSAPQQVSKSSAGLAPWQLRRVVEFLEAQLPKRIALAELAALSGQSQAHFSRAFKISTGMAPYRWQLAARIRRAQTMLLDTHVSLEQVAEATGFADAVHLGRTFRRFVGATPSAWRRERKR